MNIKTRAAVVYEPSGDFSIEQVSLDHLQANEVLVKIDACGICHTDSKFQHVLPLPGVFGHEGTGVIEEIGSKVTKVKVEDRVILGYPFCTECPSCREAEPYRCEEIPKLKFGGSRVDGSATIHLDDKPITCAFFQQSAFAEHAITLEQAVIPVKTDLPPEMLAALPCGVQTGAGAILNMLKPQANQSLVVFGAGAVGLSGVMAAKLTGVNPIICVDIVASRLELAQELGATHVIDASKQDTLAEIYKICPKGVAVAFDSSASIPGLENAIGAIGQGGKVGIVSYPKGGEKFPFNTKDLFLKVGSLHAIVQGFSIPKLFLPKLIELQKKGLFPYEKIISTYKFSEINQAMADTHSGKAIKPVLLMNN